ncbi:Phytoene dehydrogenase-related protein [Phyllobacterium sp. CL33Tsu]|uniref:phytoene desaturase family protein n=1 Tax=Phyllobacterium sp. CL33Tsu TaxID=1798191 RepID=UPI0008DF1CAD|nr:NAD(P)/FAD-dependent oxidoreductase [Phyllobacterium sp. CL33Tsu]SFJ42337.1 Phytoene dehydrogenase-related protein [Phyllobacterium sp. CL33Tsu]
MTSFDAIVIGGGHNGLVAAATLGRSGRKVLVLEARNDTGGGTRTEEFAPGFSVSTLAHVINRLHPEVVSSLELERNGLRVAQTDFMPSIGLSATGQPLVLTGAYGEGVQGAAPSDTAAWRGLREQLLQFAGILKPMLIRRPPDLRGNMALSETAALAMLGVSLKRLGKEGMRDFLRMLLMNVSDVLDEHLEDDRLKGVLAFDATLGSHLGPRSPTSLLGLYYRLTGEVAGASGAQVGAAGGADAVIAAIRSAAEKAGVRVRSNAPVGGILVERGKAVGAVLENGEILRANTVVSAISAKTTFLNLVGTRNLDTGFVRRVSNIRTHGNAAKLHLALDKLPQFLGVDDAGHRGRLVIAPSVDHVERSFNPSKYGEFSPEPVMEITLPSLVDASLAPEGACTLSAIVQYAPYALKEGWATGKPKLQAAIIAQLERYAPGIGRSIRHAELLTPVDIEQRYRIPGGHWHHGELQADQMLMSRPAFGAEGYDTPIDGLYLAGAGSHPGGGISGVPGLNAARRIIAMKG